MRKYNKKTKNNGQNNKQENAIQALQRRVEYQQKKINNLVFKTNPMQYRKLSTYQAISELHLFNSMMRHKYLYSMIHPDVAVSEGFQAKLYSDVPLPTATVGFRVVKQFATSNRGTFCLTWSPNFFSTDTGLVAAIGPKPSTIQIGRDPTDFAYSNLTFNNEADLHGNQPNNNFFFVPTYVSNVDIEKYRLVSALLKVSYNGAVTAQSGTMYSCAVMAPMPVCIVGTNNEDALDPALYSAEAILKDSKSSSRAQYGDFDIIRNGTWNYSHSITADARGIECLYVPMDPSAHQFYNNGTYFGDEGDETWREYQVEHVINNGYVTECVSQLKPEFGTQLNYVVCGQNLPIGVECVQVEIFYNFEVVPTPRTAPVLRASMDTAVDVRDYNRMLEVWRNLAFQKQFIRPATVPKPFSYQNSTEKWGPNLENLVSKLI